MSREVLVVEKCDNCGGKPTERNPVYMDIEVTVFVPVSGSWQEVEIDLCDKCCNIFQKTISEMLAKGRKPSIKQARKKNKKTLASVEPGDTYCSECDRSFATTDSFRKHISRMHQELNNWECDGCGKSFATQRGMKMHRSRYHR